MCVCVCMRTCVRVYVCVCVCVCTCIHTCMCACVCKFVLTVFRFFCSLLCNGLFGKIAHERIHYCYNSNNSRGYFWHIIFDEFKAVTKSTGG